MHMDTHLPRLYDRDLALQVGRYLPAEIKTGIEQNYYAKVEEQAHLDRFARDPEFLEHPSTHVALYSDHGVVHVRDVARQTLRVLDGINGILTPERPPGRLEFL